MRKRERGFTLIEVLAAIVLMGIVLPVAMNAVSLATSVGSTSRRKSEAAILAHSKLTEMVVTREWQNDTMNGDFGDDHPAFRWEADLKEWDSSTLKQLDVHVIWTSGGREQRVTLSTLVDTESNL